jgi:TfoX/Sxy family transcriptional regulator of competence genes
VAYDETLAMRIRDAVAGNEGLSERKMFGGLAFMVNGNMFAGIVKDELMFRVGPEAFEEALSRPGARPMDFTGRPSKGMVYVEPAGFESDEDLKAWLDEALTFAAGLPAKAPGTRRRRH